MSRLSRFWLMAFGSLALTGAVFAAPGSKPYPLTAPSPDESAIDALSLSCGSETGAEKAGVLDSLRRGVRELQRPHPVAFSEWLENQLITAISDLCKSNSEAARLAAYSVRELRKKGLRARGELLVERMKIKKEYRDISPEWRDLRAAARALGVPPDTFLRKLDQPQWMAQGKAKSKAREQTCTPIDNRTTRLPPLKSRTELKLQDAYVVADLISQRLGHTVFPQEIASLSPTLPTGPDAVAKLGSLAIDQGLCLDQTPCRKKGTLLELGSFLSSDRGTPEDKILRIDPELTRRRLVAVVLHSNGLLSDDQRDQLGMRSDDPQAKPTPDMLLTASLIARRFDASTGSCHYLVRALQAGPGLRDPSLRTEEGQIWLPEDRLAPALESVTLLQ